MTDSHINAEPLLDQIVDQLRSHLNELAIETFKIVGIRTGGVWVANAIKSKLGSEEPIGELNISFYRDDFTRIGLHPTVGASNLPFSIENSHIILVDDILMSGRTVRAALNELFDFGRPARVSLVVLADIGRRELPIEATITGQKIDLDENQRLKLQGPETLQLVKVDRG